MSDKLRVLDLCCGMGLWSVGFHRQGFECKGVDIVDVGYPYDLIISDIADYHYKGPHLDAILASPPCTEFSQLTTLFWKKGQRGPPEPEKGVALASHVKRVIDESPHTWWIVENVMRSIPFLSPIFGRPMLIAKPWVLWGNLRPFMFEQEPRRAGDAKISHTFEHHGKGGDVLGKGGGRIGLPEDFPFDPLHSWKRARIPIWLSMSIARAMKSSLEAVERPEMRSLG